MRYGYQFSLILCIFLLNACTVGPNYHGTKTAIDSQWASANKAEKTRQGAVTEAWWKNFHDPLLNRYIQTLICDNPDLKSSYLRIQQARSLRAIDTASAWPMLWAGGDVTNEKISKTGRALGSLPPNLPGIDLIPLKRNVYEPHFDMRWELDVFGKIRRTNEARTADIQAAEENSRALQQSLMAETGRNYFQFRALQQRKMLLEESIAVQKKQMSLTKQRREAGAVDQQVKSNHENRLSTLEAELPVLEGQMKAKAYQLAVLLGKQPESLLGELKKSKPLPSARHQVTLGLRSDLLRRRPDIRMREREIASGSAEIGVAVADLYPQFSLNGNYGVESLFSQNLFSAQNQVWQIGPFVRWAIFQGGSIQQNIRLKKMQFQDKVVQYQKTVLLALQEAETALEQYHQAGKNLSLLQNAEQKAKESYRLAKQRYQAGEDGLSELLQAKTALLNSQQNRLNSQADNLDKLVMLYKSLGGGWQVFA